MRSLVLVLFFFFSLPALSAPRFESCDLWNITDPAIDGEWTFKLNGQELNLGGSLQTCVVESQVRNYALDTCISSHGDVNGRSISGGSTEAQYVDFYCYLWVERTTFSTQFVCDGCDASVPTDFSF